MQVIIIHGSAIVPYGSKRFRDFLNKILGAFLEEEPNFDYTIKLNRYLKERNIKSDIFLWSAGILIKDFKRAAEELKKVIKKSKGEIIIIAKSNGAIIANLASKGLEHKIKKIIQIGCPIIPKYINKKINIINIYSKKDKTQTNGLIFNSLQSLSICKRKIQAKNVKNIELKKINHLMLNKTKLFNLYYKELISN
jgi:hypothetical protein